MQTESQFLINVLKAFIKSEKLNSNVDIDWGKLSSLAKIHSVHNILGYMLMTNPSEQSAAVYPSLRKQYLNSLALMIQRVEGMKLLIAKLEEAGIDHLLMKGYVVREYYPVPEMRSFGDIDFLIRLEDREKVHKLMLEEGFTVKDDWEPVYSYVKGMEYYEIHSQLMEVDVSDQADYKNYFKSVWEHAYQVKGHTWELCPEFHLIYLLTHIAKHISGSGAGIRMYMDIAVFFEHFEDKLDWAYVEKELQHLKLDKFANVVFTVVEQYFEVKSPYPLKPVSPEIMEDFMDYTMQGGVYGKANRDRGAVSLKKENRNEESVSKASTLFHALFPSASTIESRYTYLQGRHWLLPIAWIHRLLKTRAKWSQHVQHAKDIIDADENEVLKLKQIYKEIGL